MKIWKKVLAGLLTVAGVCNICFAKASSENVRFFEKPGGGELLLHGNQQYVSQTGETVVFFDLHGISVTAKIINHLVEIGSPYTPVPNDQESR
jgi:hypothetical protein